ncbi:MAG: restriction endonuclease subunit S [Prochloraceae cyanobacterium]|nr:restriction endonuclease subunit S [Prochloraceae cyanobacterium]
MFGDPVTNPKKWPEKPLSEFIEIIIDYRGKTPKKSNKGIPLISAANIHNGQIDLSYEQYISEEDYKVWTTRGFTQAGDILITTEAPVGEIAPYPDSGVYQISRRVMALRPNTNKILSSFLLHTMLSKNWSQRLKKVTRGSTVPRVLKPDILGQMIPYAPMNLQHKFDCFVQRHKSLTEKQKSLPNQLDNLFNSLLQKAFKGEL